MRLYLNFDWKQPMHSFAAILRASVNEIYYFDGFAMDSNEIVIILKYTWCLLTNFIETLNELGPFKKKGSLAAKIYVQLIIQEKQQIYWPNSFCLVEQSKNHQ